jgi:hypothetical protein
LGGNSRKAGRYLSCGFLSGLNYADWGNADWRSADWRSAEPSGGVRTGSWGDFARSGKRKSVRARFALAR